jgi:hypothetical protein
MIEFYYNYLKPKFGKNIKLLMTDTDSFLVYIKTEDAYQDVKNDIEWFDTSDYKMDWMPQKNKKVPGLFKDEFLGIPIREYAGLRSKMYAFRYDEMETNYCREIKSFKTEMKEKKVCKGIKKQNIEKIRFEMYKECLFNNKETREPVCNIISKKLKLYSVVVDKVALSPYDDKRYLVNQIKTLPYGYYKIDKPFKNY